MFYKGKHDREKQLRFSIRKVSFGAASVVIAAFTMFIGGGTVQADAIQSNDSSSASVSSNHQPKDSDKKTDNEDRVNTSNLKESEATFENTEPKDVISSTESFNNESRQEEKQFIKADTSKLELAVARVQALLEKTKVNEKTEEVIKSANEELAKAQDLLSNDKVIQGDIDKELSSLNNIDFILKSIPTASIEKKLEKENKNQDPRNGKAIPGKGESGFRAEETRNVESKILENGNITASGTITTNDRMGNYSPTKFSYNVKLKDGSYHANDKISITFEELGSGSSLPETLSKDGKVFARRESIEELFTNEAAKGKKTSFWAQRDDSASLEEKEQAKLKNRGTKTRFTYKFTSAIESLKDVSFGGALNDYSLRYPEVSEDKLVTAKILVNNQTVVEKEYTVNKTNIKQEKPSEAPSTISSSGTLGFGQNGELINHSEQFNFSTNKYEYGVGTTFTIKLNDKSLNKFVKSGEFKKVRANLSNKSTTANTKINEEHVILKSPRTYAEFQVISLTDDEVVVKIVGGKATSDTNYSFDWSAAGVSREPVSNTVNLYHSQTGKFGPVNETVKITKENSSDDLSGQYTTNMEISWDNPKKNSFDASGNWLKEYLELGNVAMRYINVANNNPILKATSIVKGGVAEVDKFATATPTKDFTEANVATEANNTTKKEETQNDNVKTTTATAPYIIKGTDNKYYVFREYLKNSPYKRTSTSGTVYDAVSNIVAAYDEAKYGKVTVKYVKANDTATVLRENVLKDATAKLENIVGTNYSVTPEEEFSENGVVYKLVKTDLPNNSNGVLSENPTEVVYKYVVKNQKANVVIKTTDGKHSTTVELTGEPGTALPNSEDITNKIKDLKGKGYEVESDTYNVNGAHPDFDEQEDIEAGVSKPSQTFEITLKPRIVEVPSSTPHEKDSPVDPNGENPDLKWPDGLKESDLNTTAKRVISYVKKDSNTATEEKALDDTVQTVSFTRKAKVNLVDKTVEYTDWESSNQTWEKVEVKTLVGYLADKKEIPAKEAVTPEKDTKVIPDETDKVTYTKIGSWTPINPTTGLEETPIPFPNDPTDPTKTGEITEIIPHKDGYTPKDGSGNSLTPIDPEHLDKGYHPPKITDPKANIKITYEKDDQKAKVKFVSVDPKTQQETELTDHALMLTGKTGETISERDVQTRIDVLKSMGYDIVDNPFDKNPVFDTLKDTTDKVSQEFIIKVQPRVSTAYPVYVVEGTKPSSEQLKDAVSTKGNDKTVDETKIPETTGKVGDDSLTVPITVTYGSGDKKREETVNVPVKVVKGYPQIVPVDEDKKQPYPEDSIDPDQYPEGSTFEYKEEVNTSEAGDKNVTVVVKDKAGNKLVEVPATVRVVESYPQYVPVNKEGISPKDSIDPSKFPEGTTFEYKEKPNTGSTGDKDVTVVAKLGTEIVAEIPAKIVVVDSKTQYVAENKENTQPDASKSVDEENYPEGSKFKFKEPVETSKAGDKETTVVVTDKDGNPLVEVPATVVVAKGYSQIVPVSEGNEQPSVKDSIDPDQYPEGSTFEYKEEVNTSEAGDKNVTVVVKDKAGNKLVEVPATVRVVESYPQYVPVNKEGISPKDSIDPSKFPEGTTFEYKEKPNTGSTGDKDVTVVAKLGTEIVAEIPAKIVVVDSKTQYVPVDKSNKQPDASKSIDPEQYPDGVTFKYKTPVDTTTPGEKDVIVEAKDGEDKLVEVPAKVKVVEGKEQLIPVNTTEKPQARDSITPSDYPEGSTFEYKVPDGQKEPFDATTVGDKPVTVVVKDKNGNVLVEVPATIKVVEAKPKPIETPVTNTPLTKDDIAKYVKVPEGGKVTNVEKVPDLTTPGKKTPVKVTVELPNGKTITVDVPVNVTPVKGIETPVTNTPLTPEDYTKGITIPEGGKVTNVENIPDLTTPGKKTPVKVTVELPNGKTVTVDVPVNVTPVKGIETPVTNTPLTPEDYTKGITIPEGGKVTNVENVPDLTTSGKKTPVKVTVELPNGKTITVDVPVNVTPVKGIETPVTNTPLTPEDYTKGITIPEGGKVTNVENIPDLTTPGKKTPVKVTVELPNGKTVTVDVPVEVTPVKGIETPVTKRPLTPEDYTKGIKIPEGGKVTNVENIPDLTTPGKKDPVKVTVELPNGKTITVDVPVNVTPATGIETPVTDTPLTKEDIEKNVKVPEGGKVVGVGEIPKVNTPGDKGTVKVKIELPNGKQIEVEVPVNVTPIKDIVKKLGDPITNEDIEKHIQIPEGGKIISIGDKPSTDVPGERPSVPVVIELPGGKRVTVKVPVIVTPKTTPVVVEVGTPITEDMVKQHVDLPEGWKITKVGEIPKTNTPGDKPSVTVEIELPDGRKVTVEVPVKVTPKSNHGNIQGNNGSSTTHIVTRYQDGDGKEISPNENGSHGPKTLEGYEYIGTKTDKNGNVIHTYKKVTIPTRSEQPSSPETPTSPEKPVATPVQTSSTDSKPVAVETTVANDKKELPNTGTEDKSGLASLGLLGMLGAFGLVARKKKED